MRAGMRFAGCLLAGLVAVAWPGLAPAAAAQGLPPAECVQMLRTARLAHMAGDPQAELEALRTAAEAFPDEVATTLALLDYHWDHGLPEDEHRLLQERLRRRLGDAEDPLPLPLLRQIATDPEVDETLLLDLAASVAARLETPDEHEEGLLRLLADLQERLDRDAEAASTLERLWETTGDTEVAWWLLRLDFQLDRPAEALALMESVAEIREILWPTYVATLAETGKLEAARAELDRRLAESGAEATEGSPQGEDEAAVELGFGPPGNTLAPLVEALAWAHHDAGQAAEAEALFRRALALNPSDTGLAEVILHLYAGEEERAERAAELDRSWDAVQDRQELLDEGTERLAAGDAEGAFDLLKRAAPQFPDLEAPWYNLGMAAFRLERWAETVDALGRAAELNPERAASFFFRGIALVNLERCAEAVDALERALQLDPARNQAHYYLAGCLRTLGHPEEAERHRQLYEASRSGSG